MTGTAPDVLPDWLAHDSARTWREPGGSVTSGDSVGDRAWRLRASAMRARSSRGVVTPAA